jgi:hypothetical protein
MATLEITARVLPPEEWDRVQHIPPFDQGLPDPAHWRILVVEQDGQIVGCCSLFDTVHWDGWWIAPEHQGKAGVFRSLVAEGLAQLTAANILGVHTTVPDTRPDLQDLIERFGFVSAPGKLYLLFVPDAKV